MMTMEKHQSIAGTSQPVNSSNPNPNLSQLQLAKPSGVKGANENCYVTQSPSTLLESLPYYYGCISREGAEWILYDEGCPDGMYLLRESGTDLVLSLCHHSSVLHYRINKLPNGEVVLQGLPQQSFSSPMELIEAVDGLACRPSRPLRAPFGKCLPPTAWGQSEEHLREQLLARAADFGLSPEQLAEGLDADLHFAAHFSPIVRSLIVKSLHEIQPWYHFRLSRTDAERRLEASGHLDGKFLVRERDECSYAICLSHEGRVKHYRIDILPSGNFAIQDGPKFESIIALVSHYTIFSGGLWCMLGEGCPRPQDLVRQYAEQSSAQLQNTSTVLGVHHHQHNHSNSCRAEAESASTNSTPTAHNHPHQRSRSIDRCLRTSTAGVATNVNADLLQSTKQCKQCLQAVLSVHAAAAASRRRLVGRRVSTPTNAKLKEWFTTINHKWARIKRQVILHHQRQQPLINEDNYGSTVYGTTPISSNVPSDQDQQMISCCHVANGGTAAGVAASSTATVKRASKKGGKGGVDTSTNHDQLLSDLLEHHHHHHLNHDHHHDSHSLFALQQHHHHLLHHCDLHHPLSSCGVGAQAGRYTNGYGGGATSSMLYGTYGSGLLHHRRTQFGRWPEEPAFGSRYAFDNGVENVDPNGTPTNGQLKSPGCTQHNGHLGSNSLTGTPNGKVGAKNGFKHNFDNNNGVNGFGNCGDELADLSLSEMCPALIKSSSIDTIAAITDPIEEIRRLHLHQAALDLESRNSIQTRDGTILKLDPTYRSFQACGRQLQNSSNLIQRTSSFDGSGSGGAHCNCNCGDWLLDFDVDAVDVDDPFGSILTVEEQSNHQKSLLDQEKMAMEELADIFSKSSNQTQSPLPPSMPSLKSVSPQQQNNPSLSSKKPRENGSKLMNGFTTLPSSGNHHPLQNGHSHTLRAKNTLAAAAKKCSTSSSGSGGTASMDSCGSGSGSGSGGSGGSCSGPPSGSSCKSNSSSGSGAGPGASFSSSHNSHHNHRQNQHQRSFSQATTVSFQHALLTHHLSSVCCGTNIPFGQTSATLMDTAESGDNAAAQNGEPMSTTNSESSEAVADSLDQNQPESKISDDNILATDNGTSNVNSNGKSAAPIIDLLKEFDVCFNSADHIDDDSSTLTDNSSQHSLSSPLMKRKYIDTNGSSSLVQQNSSGGGPLAAASSSKLPPPSGPPPPPPSSSSLSSSSVASTSLTAINGGQQQQCPPASSNVSTSANGTPCKAEATSNGQQQQVPGGFRQAPNGGQNIPGNSESSAAVTAEKLKDIELICLNEQAEEVQETIKRYRRGPICFDPRCISLKRRIGNGYFGDVFLATIPNTNASNGCSGTNINLAVKMLKSHAVPQQKAEILREAQTMAKLDHRHIVRLIGVCEGDPFMLVMELAPLGPLNKYLQNYGQNLTEDDLLRLMAQVARAMQYLEESNCVHRDLAARNILLVSEKFAKVSDFGMSRALGQGKDYYKARSASKWPLKWYAPECIYYYKFSSKSDVWSYGVALWEALSRGEMPYQGMDGQDILRMFAENRRLAKPEKCPVAIYQLMWSCWQFKPEDRLNFSAINDQLTHYLAASTATTTASLPGK